ncbi:MAG: SAM-dependent methyltransferase [Armatimonadetes bacterium]|nr:SAM-dependent methyltransferase [Armatimonadota bacterium]
MRLNETRVRDLLRTCDFKSLFVSELGWSHCSLSPITVSVDGQDYTLGAISEMGGLVALQCSADHNSAVPDYHVRRKIDRVVSKLHYEHIIVYCDTISQVWQWVKMEPGKPSASREHVFRYDQSGLPLIQKLDGLVFDLEELDDEGNISIKSVSERVKSALDVDKVTKRFYERFDGELKAFKKFITGMTNVAHTDWYASLMLNRLMFVYFIQKKGFLDRDPNYLRNRLDMLKERRGRDKFYSFYRSFLRVLFHDGSDCRESDRKPEHFELLGKVPYLNGGLFEEHEIEQESPDLDIPDEAFKRLFDFFDQYEWHLDSRPMHNDREINPDVLGYIFEKYINQKQMGAYYTKEDITEYISKNTIIPYLFDAAKKKCAIAFEGDPSTSSGPVWTALQENPDKYIYDAVKKGVGLPLPSEIAVGISDVSQRGEWNKSASSDYALPTEIWREVVARRQRYEEVKAKLEAGEVRSIDDLITLNLDIRQFAQDVIENTESPDLLRAFWEALRKMTVLDPTCGSGAFLFAALNILEPLYEGCLGRMQEFVDAWGDAGKQVHPNYYRWFTETIDRVESHTNPKYFIYRSIILNNLYGVDIMPEAVEICKLRLFLKLASEVKPDRSKPNMGLEPLPDIDFNIRAGNTLIGFATYAEVRAAVCGSKQKAMDMFDEMAPIEENAKEVDGLFSLFRKQQEELDVEITTQDKKNLRDKMKPLEDELNAYLARQYVIDAKRHHAKYQKWLQTHQPFHWFVEFHSIISEGGFDVLIGNPPYVEYPGADVPYLLKGYENGSWGNLYALVMERSVALMRSSGRLGLIVPMSLTSIREYGNLRYFLEDKMRSSWTTNHAIRPVSLFTGISQRVSIYIAHKTEELRQQIWGTNYLRTTPILEHLFSNIEYGNARCLNAVDSITPKVSLKVEMSIFEKILSKHKMSTMFVPKSSYDIYFKDYGETYWVFPMSFTPFLTPVKSYKHLQVPTEVIRDNAVATFNSSLFYWFYTSVSDCWHFGKWHMQNFPFGWDSMKDDVKTTLQSLHSELMRDFIDKRITRYDARISGNLYEYKVKASKLIIDEIDRVLAKHYGFTDEELDFIINYDIKYRMGLGGGDGDGDE